MPKISKRRIGLQFATPRQTTMTARKVSFEDGNSSQSSFEFEAPPSLVSTPLSPDHATASTRAAVPHSSKRLLRRLTPSICLSKLCQVSTDEETMSHVAPFSMIEEPLSPWGHFVDVIPQEDESMYKVQSFSQSWSSHRSFQPYRLELRRSPRNASIFGLDLPTAGSSTWEVEGALERMHV